MPRTSGSGKKKRSRQSLGASKIRIKYPDMNTWKSLQANGYSDEDIDEMNPFTIKFPARDTSGAIHPVRLGAGKILGNTNLHTRRGAQYVLDSEEFYSEARKPLENLLHMHGFQIASGDDRGEEWTRPRWAETSRRIVF